MLFFTLIAIWWESFSEEGKELQKMTMRVWSLTCKTTLVEKFW